MMNKTTVSIVMPTYNCENYLYATIESIQRQTHSNWELLITDDCSSDSTIKILDKLSRNDKRINFVSNKINSGAAVSRNSSIVRANGRFLAFIDSDDIWHVDKLESQLAFMKSNDYFFSYTPYELIDENGSYLGKQIDMNGPESVNYEDMLRKKSTMGCSTVMLDRLKCGEVKMPLIRTGQDYATWLSILKGGVRAYKYPVVKTKYRITPGSISRNKIKKAKRQWQIYRDIEKLSFLKSSYYFLSYAYRAVNRS